MAQQTMAEGTSNGTLISEPMVAAEEGEDKASETPAEAEQPVVRSERQEKRKEEGLEEQDIQEVGISQATSRH